VVEVSGVQTLVQVRLRDGAGGELATKTYSLRPWEQMLVSMSDLAPESRSTVEGSTRQW